MFHSEKVFIVNSREYDEEYLKISEIVCFRLSQEVIFIGAAGSQMHHADWNIMRLIRKDHSSCETIMQGLIIEPWQFTIFHPFDYYIGKYPPSGRFAIVGDMHCSHDWAIDTQIKFSDVKLQPRALIFPHRIQLTTQDDKLVDTCASEHSRKEHKAPVGEAAFFDYPSHKSSPKWFLIAATFICTICGTFCFTFLVYINFFQTVRPIRLVFSILLGALLFALAFVFAHSTYNADTVTQKLLTTPYYCNTLIAIGRLQMANILSIEKQVQIISALAEGSGIRQIERMTGVHRDTIMRLGVRVGKGCISLMDGKMRNSPCENLQSYGDLSERSKSTSTLRITLLAAMSGRSARLILIRS
jgi:hypothetical protein